MKALKVILGLLLTVSVTMAQSYVQASNVAASTNVSVLATAHYLNSITLTTTNTSATTVILFNGYPTNNLPARTNWTSYTTNKVFSYVNSQGTTNAWTNRVIQVAPVVTAASTNHSTPLAVLTVPGSPTANVAAGTPLIFTPDVPILVPSRLTLSNGATGLNYTVDYRAP